jgi:hypothetical protein
MKKILAGLAAFVFLAGVVTIARGAQTCNRTDFLCFESGPSQNLSTPFRVDAAGNLTTAGGVTATGSIAAGTIGGTGILNVAGFENYNPATTQFQIGATTSVVPTSSYMILGTTGPASAIEDIATPEISTSPVGPGGTTAFTDGTILILTSTGTTTSVQFTDNGTLAGSMLHLGAATRTVSVNKYLTLIYRAGSTTWNELSYANNAN